MSTVNLRKSFRKTFFRLFAIASLAFVFAMLPCCGRKADDDNGKGDKEKESEETVKAADDNNGKAAKAEETEETAEAVQKSSSEEEIDLDKRQLQNLTQALDSYQLDVGHYPRTLQDLVTNEDQEPNWNGPYIKSIPKDPRSKEYQYLELIRKLAALREEVNRLEEMKESGEKIKEELKKNTSISAGDPGLFTKLYDLSLALPEDALVTSFRITDGKMFITYTCGDGEEFSIVVDDTIENGE